MAGKNHSLVSKLAGAALAKLRGADEAAEELRVDKRTIRRWLAAAPEDGWQLARDLAQARLQEQLATGKVPPSQLATIAGIAERNVRYGELLRQREARKAAEGDAPELQVHQRRREQWERALDRREDVALDSYLHSVTSGAMDALDRLERGEPSGFDWDAVGVKAVMRMALDAPRGEPVSSADRRSLPWHYLPDAQYADDERYQRELDAIAGEVKAAAAEWRPKYLAEIKTHTITRRGLEYQIADAEGREIFRGTQPPAEYAELLPAALSEKVLDGPPTDKERWLVNVTPEQPAAPVPAPPEPFVEAVDTHPSPEPALSPLQGGEHLDNHPSWRNDW